MATPQAPASTPKPKPKVAKKPAAKPAWFRNKEFVINDDGIYSIVGETKDKKPILKQIHPFAAVPMATLDSIELDGTQSMYVKVRFQSGKGTEEFVTIPQGELSNFATTHLLARSGWPLPAPANRSKVIAALLAAQKMGLPNEQGYTSCGWVKPSELHLRPGHPLYTGAAPELASRRGNADMWREVMRDMIADSSACALAIAIAFGSYARGLVGQQSGLSHIFEIHGEHRRGKSTILAAVASIQGSPNKGVGSTLFDSATSNVGFEFLLSASNHGFLAVDEIDEILRRDGGTTRLMYLTNGGGRAKGNALGGLHMGSTWNTTMVTAGNATISSLCRGDMKEGALGTRTIELDIMDADLRTFTSSQVASKFLPVLSENYGHGYEIVIEAIKTKPEFWKSMYREYWDELTSDAALRHFDEEHRLAIFVALAQVGADLAGEVLGGNAARDCSEAVSLFIERYRRDDNDTLDNAARESLSKIETFKQFIADNAARFRWQGYAWSADKLLQDGKAKDLSADAIKNGALGLIRQDKLMEHDTDFEGEAILNAKGEEMMERYAGLSSTDFALAARRFGLLKTQGDGRNHVKVNGKTQREIGSSRALRIVLREVELLEKADEGMGKSYIELEKELGAERARKVYLDELTRGMSETEIERMNSEGLELFGEPERTPQEER